jgi:trans-L-3-hydroxyproline dehydratase
VLRVDTPAGQVESTSVVRDSEVVGTTFKNVPSFAVGLDETIDVPAIGEVRYDLAFGGAFYAIVDASSLGLALEDSSKLIAAGRSIKHEIASRRPIAHPEAHDLGFLYGVIFTGAAIEPDNHSRNVCVFADGEVDRSPTGTGVSSRLAILHERDEISKGDRVTIESIVGSTFTGRIVDTTTVGEHPAVVPEIEGSAHITGRAELWIDPDDVLGRGFLVR